MHLLDALSGTLVNAAAVLAGSLLGLALRGRLPGRVTAVVMQAIGLVTLLVGIVNGLDLTRVSEPPGIVLAIVSMAIGGAIGEALGIEEGLERFGDALRRRLGGRAAGEVDGEAEGEGTRFTEGFVAASLLFCVGPLTLIGSIQNGLVGDASFLYLKSALDGFASLALAATFGLGVAASVLTVLGVQGGLALGASLFAGLIPDPAADPRVLLVNGVGGLMILGLGLSLLEIRRLRVASLLPALPLVVAAWYAGRALLP